EGNRKSNVLIATHVPTKDDFGTSHAMNQDDALVFERILKHYKKDNENVTITVLFGHLHVLHRWTSEGVNYIITGNGSGKSYVRDQRKSALGRGIITVSSQGLSYDYQTYE